MTFDNSKRLYNHYLKVGNATAAATLLNKYPELAENAEPDKKKE